MKLSVIVPVYNVENYLNKCITSIVEQTYKALEIILVDDGATDCSGAIADSYAAKDKRIKVFHKENGGLSDARNYGLDHVTGDYILFVDSDDFIENTMCERLFTVANSTNADMVSCNYYIYRGDDDISIFNLTHVKKSERIRPDYVSRRTKCLDFESYAALFQTVHDDLKAGRRKLVEFK